MNAVENQPRAIKYFRHGSKLNKCCSEKLKILFLNRILTLYFMKKNVKVKAIKYKIRESTFIFVYKISDLC